MTHRRVHFVLAILLLLIVSNAYCQRPVAPQQVLRVTPSVNINAEGGSRSISVTSSGSWKVASVSNPWLNASKASDTQLNIRAAKNTTTTSRWATITITMGSKTAIVTVTQAAGSTLEEDNSGDRTNDNRTTEDQYFSISPTKADFSASGGSMTFTVSSSSTWNIYTWTNNWGSLSKNGNKLTLTVGANPNQSSRDDYFILRSGSRSLRVNITQSGEATLSVSQEELSFESSGGSAAIDVRTNGSWNISTQTNSWGHLTKDGNQLRINVDANSGTSARTDYFEITSGNKTKRIRIRQAGHSTSLSVSKSELSFSSSCSSTYLTVTTNSAWRVSTNPASWGHITIDGNQLKFTVDANNSSSPRTDYFVISSGDKSQQVNITQQGKSNSAYSSSSISDYSDRRHSRSFNHKWDNYASGFTVGYIQKQWTSKYEDNSTEKYGLFDDDKYYNGIQAGFRIDPQFGAGFGMNSGLFYEYCWGRRKSSDDEAGRFHVTYEEHGLYMPLDLKFTMNFSRWFQLSFYGGVGLNYVLSGKSYMRNGGKTLGTTNPFKEKDNWKRLNVMLEYGASIRISSFQFDVTMAKGLNDWSDTKGTKITQGRPLCISTTICF